MADSGYDLLARALTNAYIAGRKSGYLEGLTDSALHEHEVTSRFVMLFERRDEEQS